MALIHFLQDAWDTREQSIFWTLRVYVLLAITTPVVLNSIINNTN